MRNELDPIKLWVPEESDFIANYKTVLSTIKDGFSPEILIMTSKTNVLTPKNMRRLYVIDEAIRNIVIKRENGSSITYNDVCFK
jgi:predicted RND superfamily exporter protein